MGPERVTVVRMGCPADSQTAKDCHCLSRRVFTISSRRYVLLIVGIVTQGIRRRGGHAQRSKVCCNSIVEIFANIPDLRNWRALWSYGSINDSHLARWQSIVHRPFWFTCTSNHFRNHNMPNGLIARPHPLPLRSPRNARSCIRCAP